MCNKFKLYEAIKRALGEEYLGYKISTIVAIDIAASVFGCGTLKKSLMLKFFLRYDLNIESSGVIASIGDYKRSDYYEILDYIGLTKCGLVDFSKTRYVLAIPKVNVKLFYKYYISLKGLGLTVPQTIYILTAIQFYKNNIDNLNIQNIECTKYVAFNGSCGMEALLTQYFKINGVVTYTLQHGIYYKYECDIPLDVINYENFSSDYMLCWGQYSKDELVDYGIKESMILVSGYPREIIINEFEKNVESFNSCIVLLSRTEYENSNMGLINILKEFSNMDFFIKLHPALDHKKYEKCIEGYDNLKLINDFCTFTDYILNNKPDIAISVNTTAYYEMYVQGVPCLRYCDNSFDVFKGVFEDIFYTRSDMVECLDDIKLKISLDGSKGSIQKSLKYLIGSGINNYKNILFDDDS